MEPTAPAGGGVRPPCSACGAACGARALLVQDGHPIYRCPACRTLVVYPQPGEAEVLSIYGPSYFSRGNKYGAGAEAARVQERNDAEKLGWVRRHGSRGRLLDVGCATGTFLAAAQRSGWDVFGVEVSPHAGGLARELLGDRVHVGTVASAGLAPCSFDVVTLWDTVEHVRDPAALIAEIARLLKPGGWLVLSTGDSGSPWARLTGKRWPLLTPPQHLHFFTRAGLRLLLGRAGLAVEEAASLPKTISLDLLSLKAEESFGVAGAALRRLVFLLRAGRLLVGVNLRDIVVCAARKPAGERKEPPCASC